MEQKITQAIVATQAVINPHQTVEKFVLFDASGTPISFSSQTGAGVLLTGYSAEAAAAVAATDTVNEAIAKLEARLAVLEAE